MATYKTLPLYFYSDVNLFSSVTTPMMMPVTMKIPSIPQPIMGRTSISRSGRNAKSILLTSNHTANQRQDQAAGDNGGDLAGNVDADGMHQQEILVVLLQAQLVDHTGGHGER